MTGVSVSDITATGATISWTDASNTGATYTLYHGEDEVFTTAAGATSYTLTGLTSNTAYSGYTVVANCGEEDHSAAATVPSFRTACGTQAIPYTENFDSYPASSYSNGVSVPSCWTMVPTPTSYSSYTTVIYNAAAHSGSNHLRSYYATNNKIILPEMAAPTNTLQIRFWHRPFYTNYGKLQVGYMTDAEDTSTFVAVQTFQSTSTTYAEAEVSMASAPADARIAFRHLGSGGYNYAWYIDDITVEAIPSCLRVTDLAVSDLTANGATLTWADEDNTGATYTVTASAAGQDDIVASGIDALTYTFTTLLPNTEYTFSVVANCSESDASTAATATARTACAAIGLPYVYGFEEGVPSGSYQMPYCWTKYNEDTGNFPYAYSSSYSAHGGSNSLYFYFYIYGTYPDVEAAILPQVDVATYPMSGNQLEFWARSSSTSAGIEVGTVTDPDDFSTYVMAQSFSFSSTDTYTKFKVNFGEGTGAYPVILVRKPSSSSSLYVDDITLRVRPACDQPLSFARGAYTSQSVALSWVNGSDSPTQWLIERTVGGVADTLAVPNADVVYDGNAVSYTLAGLDANTAYSLRLACVCGTDTTEWADATLGFTTQRNECAITAFDITTAAIRRGDAAIDAESHTIVMPIYYTEDLTSASGSFSYSTSAAPYLYNEETEAWDISVSSFYYLKNYLVQGSPLTVRVFAQDRNFYTDWTLTLQPEDCTTPTALTLAPERIRIAVSVANPDPTVEDYQLVCSTAELDADGLAAAEKTAFSGSSYTIEGLTRETLYYVYVRSSCGSDSYSEWRMASATTLGLNYCTGATVADGTTTNGFVMLRSQYQDAAHRSQVIYPAEMLTDLVGKSLTSVKFYTSYTTSIRSSYGDWAENNFAFSIGTTEAENLSSAWDDASTTLVHDGSIATVTSNGEMVIEFDTPFTYTGGNLLIDLVYTIPYSSRYTSGNFYGVTSAGGSRYVNGNTTGSGSAQAFLPKATFGYCESLDACPTVTNIEASDIDVTTATLTWEASTGDYVSSYDVFVSTTELSASELAAYDGPYNYQGTETTCALTGLANYTQHYVYVRAICAASGHDEGSSTWASATLHTASLCRIPTNLAADITGKTEATVTWSNGGTSLEQGSNFTYILSTVAIAEADLDATTPTATAYGDTSVVLPGLLNDQTYHFYLKNDCGSDGPSPWVSTEFTTYVAMPAVVSVAADEVTHTAVAASWQRNVAQFANEEAWQVALVPAGSTPADWTTVTTMHHTFIGLTPETVYDLHVRPYDAVADSYGPATILEDIATAALPGSCLIAANGTTTNSNLPIYGYWTDADQVNQMIYPASMLEDLSGKTLNSLKFFSTTDLTGWGTRNITLKLAEIEAATLTNFVTPDAWTTVFSGDINKMTDGFSVDFATPYVYNGGNLLVEIDYEAGSYESKTFYGISRSNAGIYSYDDNDGVVQSFLPKVQFCYEAGSCRDMARVTVSDVTTNSANVSWMPGNTETEWQYVLNAGALTAAELEAATKQAVSDVTEQALTGLTPDVDYYFYMRPVCGVDEYGSWTVRQFQTVATCGLPTLLAATSVTATSATLNAQAHETIGTAATYTFRYWLAGDEANKTTVPASDSDTVAIAGLTYNSTYFYDVMVSCTGEDGDSRWTEPRSFTTDYQNHTLPYSTTFAEGSDNEWRMVNGSMANQWTIDTAASNTANGRGLYISNDGGKTNAYNNGMDAVVYAYVGFSNFEADKQYTVSFQWMCNGESTYDYLRAWLVADDVTLTASTSLPAGAGTNTNPAGWIAIDGSAKMNLESEWQTQTGYVTVPEDGAYKLVFMWRNDGSAGSNPPAAIDSVVIRESDRYSVTTLVRLDAEEGVMGTVGSEPETLTDLYANTLVSLAAEPAYGYQFANWENGNGDTVGYTAVKSFHLMGDTTMKANFDSVSFTIAATTPDLDFGEVRGTVDGTATVKFNLPVTLTATANEGYHFVDWTSEVEGEPVVAGTEAELTVNAYRDSVFTAVFDTNEYTVSVAISEPEMGSVEGSATMKHFTNGTYVATANYGYHFVNWTNEDGDVLAADAYLTLTAVSDTALTANFDYNKYTVTALSADEATGTVSGTATVNYLTEVTLTATPAEGYHLASWSNGDTTESIAVSATEDMTLTATFAVNVYAVNGTVNDEAMGTVNGSGDYEHFSTATLTAEPATGYHFVNWTDANGTELGTAESFILSPVSDTTVRANFAINVYTITLNHNEGGYVTDAEDATVASGTEYEVEHGTELVFTAHFAEGFRLGNWNDGTTTVHTAEISYTALRNATLTATFVDAGSSQVTLNVNDAEMGTVQGAGAHHVDGPVTIAATAADHYHFTHWMQGETIILDNPYTFTMGDDIEFTAYFAIDTHSVALTADAAIATVSGAGRYTYGSQVTVGIDVASPCYNFRAWMNGDEEVSTEPTYTFTLTGDVALAPAFDRPSYTGSETAVACSYYEWKGNAYSHSGDYTFDTLTVLGCDSTITLHLTINTPVATTIEENVCDSYLWEAAGATYTTSGTYRQTFVADNGCDSVVTLNLTVRSSSASSETATACDSYEWKGQTYTESGLYDYHTTNLAGCDSTLTLHLTINPSRTSSQSFTACDSYEWKGQTYTESGVYTYQTQTTLGCDSTVTLNLTINNSNTGVDVQTACDSYTWIDGQTYTASNSTATYTLTNASGCDSVVTLNLTLGTSNTGTDVQTACDSYTWIDGQTYTASNSTATYALTNASGCDSVVTLNLTVKQSSASEERDTACVSFTWNGEVYTESGDYTYTVDNAAGCDSVVTLHLVINQPVEVSLDVTAVGSYEWNDETYDESGVYTFTTEGANGCDSITTLNLTITPSPIYYTVTVLSNDETMGTVSGSCTVEMGSTVTVTATPKPGYHLLRWDNGETSLTLTFTVYQDMTLTAIFQSDTVDPAGIEEVELSDVQIYVAEGKIVVKGAAERNVYLYDVNGRCISRRKAGETTEFIVATTGVYLVKVDNAPAKRVVVVR